MFPLEIETRLYCFSISITTDTSPAQTDCSRTKNELWNSIAFLIFKTSLAIIPASVIMTHCVLNSIYNSSLTNLSNLSKIYEKLMYNQLFEYFYNILFSSQCSFRKEYSSQHCLLVMIEKFKETVDREKKFDALLTDLYKAFDCITHTLFIAKMCNYRVSSFSTKHDRNLQLVT